MPHQCTECGRVFPDGSKEMLSGCPDCGGNTFQFKPDGASSADDPASDDTPPEPPGADSTVTETVSRATRTVREWVTDRTESDAGRDGEDDAPVSGGTPTSPSDGARADTKRSADGFTASDTGERPELSPSDDAEYPEWPNPDGADTSGVGKGPSARRERESETSADSDRSESESTARTSESTARTSDQARGASSADEFEWTEDPAASESTADSSYDPDAEPDWTTDGISARTEDREDDAQASARSDVVTPDELPGPMGVGGAAPESSSDPDSDDSPHDVAEPQGSEGSQGTESPQGTANPTADGPDVLASSERPEPASAEEPTPSAASDPETPSEGRVVDTPSSEGRPDLDELREELNDQFESIKIVSPGQYELNLMELYDRDEYIISLREDGRYVIEVAESWRNDE
ncbi:MAG TPA: Zn-ribbon containing protein [Natrialbaceae archaeon]|nr:Zn-ribbon containing protein [Natrialbaceae archaeon]